MLILLSLYIQGDLLIELAQVSTLKINQFNSQECSKLLYGYNHAPNPVRTSPRCLSLISACTESKIQKLNFPALKTEVELEYIIGGGRHLTKGERESTGATGATGGNNPKTPNNPDNLHLSLIFGSTDISSMSILSHNMHTYDNPDMV